MVSRIVEQHVSCPVCPSSDAYCIYDDGHGYCFSCGHYHPPNEGFNPLSEDTYTYEYLEHRGLSKESFRTYDSKCKIDKDGKPISIGFRYPNGSYKIRDLAKKEFRTQDFSPQDTITKAGLFGRDKFSAGSHKYITITEGEYDAISLHQVLRIPVVSIQSSSSAIRDCSVDYAYLASFERIYLAFDNDVKGRDALRSVAKLFDYNKVYCVRLTKHKDANEYVEKGDSDELKQIWHNAKKYLPDTVKSEFSEFRDILKQEPKWGVPYPFPTLTKMTYGIRTGESVLITAQEKVGKTELMHAIEHQLLKVTNDPIGAIFLEEPIQRHLQALAGYELGVPAHLPDSGCTPTQVSAALEKLVRVDGRLHVYSHFGSDSPDVLLDTIRFLVSSRGCRYILLDHISMVVSGLSGEDERRALDYLSTRLVMLVKELDFALIFVSHLNDNGQTRGSRYIGKVCDIRIDISRDMVNPDPIIRNTVNVFIPYNRYSGRSGPAGTWLFDPKTYWMKEVNPTADNDNTPVVMRDVA